MKNKSVTKIALIQMSMDSNPETNFKKSVNFIAQAFKSKPDLICLPELFLNRYFCQNEDHDNYKFAEKIPGKYTDRFLSIAKKFKVNIIVPLFEKEISGVYYNSIAMINSNGKYIGKYRKIHIPDDPSYFEKFYFKPGNLGFKVFETAGLNAGTLICWDQWFSEGARATALLGANILFYPTAIGYHPAEKTKYGPAQLDSWTTVQRGHAISNGVYVAACNRTGFEPHPTDETGIEFWGNSFICDPQGKIIAKAGSDTEEILFADIDLKHQEKVRQHWPFLRDRRPEEYNAINSKNIC